MQVINVIFSDATGKTHTPVRLSEAASFYRSNQGLSIKAADFMGSDGKERRCYAKQWMTWNPTDQVWELASIGLGAYGDERIWTA
jgi:chitodextrinase